MTTKKTELTVPKNDILAYIEAPEHFSVEEIAMLPVIEHTNWKMWTNKQRYKAIKVYKKKNKIKDTELVAWFFWSCSFLMNTVKHISSN